MNRFRSMLRDSPASARAVPFAVFVALTAVHLVVAFWPALSTWLPALAGF